MMQNNSAHSPYLQNLQNNPEQFQVAIEGLLKKYQVQPVGNGYIDLILDNDNSLRLIDELTKLYVALEELTWWCHYTPETKLKYGCPHGMGGPTNRFGDGMFSECVQYPDFVVKGLPNLIDEYSVKPKIFAAECNKMIINYIKNILPLEKFYSPCLYVGLWIYVPNEWKRKYYWIKG